MAAAVIDEAVGHRGLHLVDLENLLGDPWARGPSVGRAFDEYLDCAAFRRGDLVFVAGNPWLMVELEWSRLDSSSRVDCHRFAARGPQGADLKLLEASPLAWVARRFERLVVGSGDGVFADRLVAAHASGLSVQIVSRRDSLSSRLERLDFPTEWFGAEGQASARRTSARRPMDASTAWWSSARWRTITSVPPISPKAANASATIATLPHTGALGSKPR